MHIYKYENPHNSSKLRHSFTTRVSSTGPRYECCAVQKPTEFFRDRRCSVPNGLRTAIGRRYVPAVSKVEYSGEETRNLKYSDIMPATLKSSAFAPIGTSRQRPSMTSFGGCVHFFSSPLCQTLVDYNVEKKLG
jgi:hypothetical protein